MSAACRPANHLVPSVKGDVVCRPCPYDIKRFIVTEWCPKVVHTIVKMYTTSTQVARVTTDAGDAYLKALGNPEGPHALVCDLVGTRLAKWLGLLTLDMSIIDMAGSETKITFANGDKSLAAPALITRAIEGDSWSGSSDMLEAIENKSAPSGLIVFDTWTRNADRYLKRNDGTRRNLENVMLSEDGASAGKFLMMAIDHTSCFRRVSMIRKSLRANDSTRDTTVYGLFSGFAPHVAPLHVREFAAKLTSVSNAVIDPILHEVPRHWELSSEVADAVKDFLLERAQFVGKNIEQWLSSRCNWKPTLPFPGLTR